MLFRRLADCVRHDALALLPGARKRAEPAPEPAAAAHESASRESASRESASPESASPESASPESASPASASLESDDRRNGYVSEFTRFMEGFMKSHPEAETEQRRGWSMYWNRKVDFERMEEEAADTVPTDPYYYFAVPPTPASDVAPASDAAPPSDPDVGGEPR